MDVGLVGMPYGLSFEEDRGRGRFHQDRREGDARSQGRRQYGDEWFRPRQQKRIGNEQRGHHQIRNEPNAVSAAQLARQVRPIHGIGKH